MDRHSKIPGRTATSSCEVLTEPFGLIDRLKQPKIRMEFIPVLDLIVLALLISLLFTRFVMLPGVSIQLPETELRMQHDRSELAVLTMGNQGMLFFAGRVYEHASIERAFQRYFVDRTKSKAVLLIKAEASIDLQLFLDLCSMAQSAGFDQVQIAGEAMDSSQTTHPSNVFKPTSNMPTPLL